MGSTLVCVLLLASCTSRGPTAHSHSGQTAFVQPAASSRPGQQSLQQPAAPCTWRQLAMNYYGGGAGMGSDFGLIRLRDTAQAPCSLSGPVGVVGLDSTGAVDTMTLIYHAPHVLTLTPRTAKVEAGHDAPAGTTVATVQIGAEYRDQPHGGPAGLCTKRVIPAQWRVTLAIGSMTVANATSGDPDTAFRRLLTCAGELGRPTAIVSR